MPHKRLHNEPNHLSKFFHLVHACASAPGPKPIQGIPLRPIIETPFVEKVHLSNNGRSSRISTVSTEPFRVSP